VIHEYPFRFEHARFAIRYVRPTRDDHEITRLHQMGRRSIDADLTPATFALDHVRRQPIAVGAVPDVDPLVGQHIRRIQQVLVDRDRTLILDVGFGDRRAMNFRSCRVSDVSEPASPSPASPSTMLAEMISKSRTVLAALRSFRN
jgi:hypothetical protein